MAYNNFQGGGARPTTSIKIERTKKKTSISALASLITLRSSLFSHCHAEKAKPAKRLSFNGEKRRGVLISADASEGK